MVWSAGLAPVKLISNSSSLKLDRERVIVDEHLRVPGTNGRVFAMGDCAAGLNDKLPPTATVAEQQALYLVQCFNKCYSKSNVLDENNHDMELPLLGPVIPALGEAWCLWGLLEALLT